MEIFKNMFGKVAPGMCRLSIDGNVAVKTSSGFRSYDMKTGRLMNCEQFVFNIGEEFFFLIPTNKVSQGDIILADGKPKCVLTSDKDKITVINYETSVIENVLPEHYVFMGNTYFYGKIVSMFEKNSMKGKKGPGIILKYMMFSEMMKGNEKKESGILPFLMMQTMGKGAFMDDLFEIPDEEEPDAGEE